MKLNHVLSCEGAKTIIAQQIFDSSNEFEQFDTYLNANNYKKVLLVCGNAIKYFNIGKYFDSLEKRSGVKVIRFSDFNPNPSYDSIVKGIEILNDEKCDLIVAVGGGSAMDVAKCIKLYSNMDHTQNYLKQIISPNDIELVAVPTTAGTGSEATRFAVIYYGGEKQSISDYSCIPSVVIVDPSVLEFLPEYQKKSTMLDALCHAIESYWSINSTDESKTYACEAIKQILFNYKEYLANNALRNSAMLKAANLAGKAINITQTTAGHAMCYKLTSIYGIAHGHAAALCVSKLFPFMIKNTDKCIDPRGKEHLKKVFDEIAIAFGSISPMAAAQKFDSILAELELNAPEPVESDFEVLKASVNPDRLKNNPIDLDINTIDLLYYQILKQYSGS